MSKLLTNLQVLLMIQDMASFEREDIVMALCPDEPAVRSVILLIVLLLPQVPVYS